MALVVNSPIESPTPSMNSYSPGVTQAHIPGASDASLIIEASSGARNKGVVRAEIFDSGTTLLGSAELSGNVVDDGSAKADQTAMVTLGPWAGTTFNVLNTGADISASGTYKLKLTYSGTYLGLRVGVILENGTIAAESKTLQTPNGLNGNGHNEVVVTFTRP